MASRLKRPKVSGPEVPERPVPAAVVPADQPSSEVEIIHPTAMQDGGEMMPTSQYALRHNVMLRQNREDAVNGIPQEEVDTQALDLLKQLQQSRKTGASIKPLLEPLKRLIQGTAVENKITAVLYRKNANMRLRRWLEASENLDSLLCRAAKRGDLSPSESIAMMGELKGNIKTAYEELMRTIKEDDDDIDLEAAFKEMDLDSAKSDAESRAILEGTTPQGREFARKVDRRLSQEPVANAEPQQPPKSEAPPKTEAPKDPAKGKT